MPINSKAEGLRAMSTPNPDRQMEFEYGTLPEFSSLNLAEDVVSEKGQETLESPAADEHKDSPLWQNESASDKVNEIEGEKDESNLNASFSCPKDSNDVEDFEQEKEDVVDDKQNEDGETTLPKDVNGNFVLEDEQTKSKSNDIESTENEVPESGSEEPLLEGQRVPMSRDQEVDGPLVGRNRFRSSNPSMSSRSGLGVVPVYIGQMTGRVSYRTNKSTSRTYPFTRKYY